MKRQFYRSLLAGTLVLLAACLIQSCNKGKTPEWAAINKQVIKKNNVVGRVRKDFPKTGVKSNLADGKVDNINNLPELKLADGVSAKAYWGKGQLVSLITMEPNSFIPEKSVKGERFMFVFEGDVQELINGEYVSLKAITADSPDGTHGNLSKREFVYLQDGSKTAIKAGAKGAQIIEVYSPVPAEYLVMAGIDNIPKPVDMTFLSVKPTVEPNRVYDLDEIQFTELVPGSNARIVGGYGAQISVLRMDANAVFEHHIHPEEQVMIAMRGWIDEIILDKVVRMQKGDILYLPSDMVHGGHLGPYGCDAIDVFFPPRADYEAKRQGRMAGYHAIIPENATIQTVVDGGSKGPGLTFTEGPVWVNGKLYFSNMYFDANWNGSPAKSTLVEMDTDGTYRYILKGKRQTNGIINTAKNILLVCDMFGHRIVEMDTKGNVIKVVVDKYEGKSLDGPNDLVRDAKGGIYFTDPQFTADPVKNQPGRTAYYINPKGELIRILEPNAFAMPNGIALSPDEKILYINNTYDNETWWNVDSDKDNFVWAYDIQEDGTITNGRKFAQLNLTAEVLDREGRSSGADGMKVDASGNLYVCTYAGIQIFNPEGKFVGIINMPTHPVNCAFGGSDMQTLYITSFNKIYSIRTNMKGMTSPM